MYYDSIRSAVRGGVVCNAWTVVVAIVLGTVASMIHVRTNQITWHCVDDQYTSDILNSSITHQNELSLKVTVKANS